MFFYVIILGFLGIPLLRWFVKSFELMGRGGWYIIGGIVSLLMELALVLVVVLVGQSLPSAITGGPF